MENHYIEELQTPDNRSRLEGSLKKDDGQSVTFLSKGGKQKRYLEANPQFKNLNRYDDKQMRASKNQQAAK